MNQLESSISAFESISLAEMDGVALLKRVDTKFVFARKQLPGLLNALRPDYRMLEINGIRLNRYRTQYFDTSGFKFYLDHHNGKLNRSKVRFREYIGSDIAFLEVKQKSNKGITRKSRIKTSDLGYPLSQTCTDFLSQTMGTSITLYPALVNHFKRLTLVHKSNEERFTIDLDLHFSMKENRLDLPEIVVAELKQGRKSRLTDSAVTMRDLRIKEQGFSKYCMGMALMRTGIKKNNFKEKQLFIQKLQKLDANGIS